MFEELLNGVTMSSVCPHNQPGPTLEVSFENGLEDIILPDVAKVT